MQHEHLLAAVEGQASPAKPDPKFLEARKKLISLLNWVICDEKHLTLSAIHETLLFLQKLQHNVLANPDEQKYRKVRISNALFGRHVRDVPGGEEFMRTAGWRVKVVDMERYWVFEGVPGAPAWALLEAAGAEVDKTERVVAAKLSRAVEDKVAANKKRLEAVRSAMDDDKAQRALRIQAHAEQLVAVQAQNEARALEEAELLRQAAAEARAEREQKKSAHLGGGSGGVAPRAPTE